MNDGAEDFAGFDRWRSSVEQTLNAAAVKEQRDQAKSAAEATEPEHISQEEASAPVDIGIDREVARLRANTLNPKSESNAASDTEHAVAAEAETAIADPLAQETKPSDPFSPSPLIAPVLPERLDAPAGRHTNIHAWGRGHWRGRHYGWRYHRLTGVARAFPFALFVR
jgi:hypothetical protein